MITIDQLLESVDLDFEPRWVTKDENGWIGLWEEKPIKIKSGWVDSGQRTHIGCLKLSEFKNKYWTECIYEVPRKTDEYEQNLEKLRPADSDLVYRVKLPRKITGKIERFSLEDFVCITDIEDYIRNVLDGRAFDKLNALVDAVNELKGAKNE